MLSFAAFFLAAAAFVAALVAGRWAAGLPFGARRLRDAIAPWANEGAPLRVARAVGSNAGYWLGIGLTLAAMTMLTGANVLDETSMRVSVTPGGPGERAGIRSGDRIVAVEGEPIASWDQLREVIAARGGRTTRVKVQRDGVELAIDAVPEVIGGERARLMVGPYREHRPGALGPAVADGLATPPRIVFATLRALARMLVGSERTELSGPVGVISEVNKANGPANAARLAAALASYVWPLLFLSTFALAFVRRRRPGS